MRSTGRRFRLLDVVGRGSFGTVYRAVLVGSEGFEKEVALKLLNPDAAVDLDMAQRLRDEARLLGLVRHRAILKVDSLVQLESRWAVVMEYVDGVHLRRVLQDGPVPLAAALEIVAEVANALHAAFAQPGPDGSPLRLIHRDIKPSNLQITPAGEVKLLDFGVARAEYAAREAVTDAVVLGSLGYMAPERLEGFDGPEGDVYALGVVAWEAIVGRRLGRTFIQPNRHQTLIAEAILELRRRVGARDRAVTELFAAMLAYDPAQRPSAKDVERSCRVWRRRMAGESLGEWADRAVRPLLDERPQDPMTGALLVEATSGQGREPSPSEPTARRQLRAWPAAMAAVLGVGVATIGTVTWGYGGPDSSAATVVEAPEPVVEPQVRSVLPRAIPKHRDASRPTSLRAEPVESADEPVEPEPSTEPTILYARKNRPTE